MRASEESRARIRAEAAALWQSLGSLDALASRQLAEARAYGARVTRRRELLSLVRSTARPWMRRAQ
jgi:hypothetical protein